MPETKLELVPETTLQEAKKFLRDNWKDGCTCLACGQHVQLYSRPITSSMAYGLILLYKAPRQFIHIEEFLKTKDIPASIRGDFSKLRYWDLIEPSENYEGHYKITDTGILFVRLAICVRSHVLLYNNKSYGLAGERVNIKYCLKKKFDYNKLMKGVL